MLRRAVVYARRYVSSEREIAAWNLHPISEQFALHLYKLRPEWLAHRISKRDNTLHLSVPPLEKNQPNPDEILQVSIFYESAKQSHMLRVELPSNSISETFQLTDGQSNAWSNAYLQKLENIAQQAVILVDSHTAPQ
jgi:hypothetical protein